MRCIHCGCSETTPCAGGCGWAATDPPRCDAPACLAKQAQYDAQRGQEPDLAATEATRQHAIAQLCGVAGCTPAQLRVTRATQRIIEKHTADPTGRYALVERSFIRFTAFAILGPKTVEPAPAPQADGGGS